MRRKLIVLVALLGALTVAAPAHAETITGTFRFQDRTPSSPPTWTSLRPIAAATVVVESCMPVFGNCPFWSFEASTATDSTGSISVSRPFRGAGLRYRVKVFATNPAVEVWPKVLVPTSPYSQEPGQPDGAPISRTVSAATDVLDFSYDFVEFWSSAHFNIADTMLAARTYAAANRDPLETDPFGAVKAQATSSWPGTDFYNPVNKTITVVGGDMFEDFVLLHEYAHFLQHELSHFAPIPAMHDGCFARQLVTGTPINSEEHAWMEGFADYFSAVVRVANPAGRFEGTAGAGTPRTGALELPTVIASSSSSCTGVTSMFAGDQIELFAAGALWDLFDQVGDPREPTCTGCSTVIAAETPDTLARRDREIFQIFDRELDTAAAPRMRDFRVAWLNRGLPASALGSIWTDNGLPFRTGHAAIANAGPDQQVNEGALVTLDGRASEDPENGPMGFSWVQISGPAVTQSSANLATSTFTAPQVGPSGATLVFRLGVSDATFAGSTDLVTVQVRDISPSPSLAPTWVAFGKRTVGTTSTQVVTLSNGGPGALAISSVTSSDPRFVPSSACGTTLAPGSSCSISVAFTPASNATYSGWLRVFQPNGSWVAASLAGEGGQAVAALSIPALDFGPTNVGSQWSQNVTLSNVGNAPLGFTGFTSWASPSFSYTSCAASIPAGGSCTVTVTFAPTLAGGAGGYLRFDHDGGGDRWLWLTGSGIPVGKPNAWPSAVSFGSVDVGQKSPVRTIHIGNTGGAPLTVGGVGVHTGHWADFVVVADSCSGMTIPAATSSGCTIDVLFMPQAGGARSAKLSVGTTNGPATVQLDGDGIAKVGPSPWTHFGGGPFRGGLNPLEFAVDSSAARTLHDVWTAGSAPVQSSPAVADGVAYAGDDNGELAATDVATGKQLWSLATKGAIVSSPAFDGRVVYAGSNDDSVYAVDAASGKLLWSFATGDDVVASPAVGNGLVIVGSLDGTVYALEAASGSVIWKDAIGAPVLASPALAGRALYVGAANQVRAYDVRSGKQIWTAFANGAVRSTPAVAGGRVYVGSDGGNVYAFEAATGAQAWSFATGGAVRSSPAVAYGLVFVGSDDGMLYALDAAAGVPRWAVHAGVSRSAPAVANGVVYVTLADGRLLAYDAWAETVLADLELKALSSPGVADGLVVVGTASGLVGLQP